MFRLSGRMGIAVQGLCTAKLLMRLESVPLTADRIRPRRRPREARPFEPALDGAREAANAPLPSACGGRLPRSRAAGRTWAGLGPIFRRGPGLGTEAV